MKWPAKTGDKEEKMPINIRCCLLCYILDEEWEHLIHVLISTIHNWQQTIDHQNDI